MNKKLVLTFAAFSLAFTACAGFNPNNRKVLFFNGQAYKIPYGVGYSHPYNGANKHLNDAGINCGDADIVWIEANLKASLRAEPTSDQLREFYAQGKIGCSSPLSDQELQYTMHEENIAQQRSAESSQNLRHMQMMNQQQHNEFMRQQQRNIDRFIYGY